MKSSAYGQLQPAVVLGVAAHPDDLDFGAGGTLAAFAQQGAAVYYFILTDGSKGTADKSLAPAQLIAIRHDEQWAASKLVGGKDVFFGSYTDGELKVNMQLKKDIVRVIRSVRPDVVVTMDPSVLYIAERGMINHPDHRAAGQATLDAVYPLARDHLAFPELSKEGYNPHKVATLLLINFAQSNFYVDISGTLDTKFKAVAAHASQVADITAIRQRFTKIARDAGKRAGTAFAEGFMRIDIQ